MSRGYLDAVTTSGHLEGWAVDDDQPCTPLHISVEQPDGMVLAEGYANRYRQDLCDAEVGIGWNAFRLRFEGPIESASRNTLVLRAHPSGEELHRVWQLPIREIEERPLTTVEDVAAADPTIVTEIDSLVGCAILFNDYIRAHGRDAFVRAAYLFVLGRPADPEGLALYGRLIRQSAITPYALLRILADSDEFRGRNRSLSAPNTPGFPFRAL